MIQVRLIAGLGWMLLLPLPIEASPLWTSIAELLRTPASKVLFTRTTEGSMFVERVLGRRLRTPKDYEVFIRRLGENRELRKIEFQEGLEQRLRKFVDGAEELKSGDNMYWYASRFGRKEFLVDLTPGSVPRFFSPVGSDARTGEVARNFLLQNERALIDHQALNLPTTPVTQMLGGKVVSATVVVRREYMHMFHAIAHRLENFPWENVTRFEEYAALEGRVDQIALRYMERPGSGVMVFEGKTLDEVKLMDEVLPIEHLR